jgi:hypothetical protein
MRQTALTFLLVTGCVRATFLPSDLPEDTHRDLHCVLGQLAQEKTFDVVEAVCMPGEGKRLVSMLYILEASDTLMKEKAYVSVQCSIVLHEEERRGFQPALAPGEISCPKGNR